MRLENDKIDIEVVTFFDNSENYAAIVPNIQLDFLKPCNNACSLNNENNAPRTSLNVMDENNFTGASERLCESVIVLLCFQKLVQQ